MCRHCWVGSDGRECQNCGKLRMDAVESGAYGFAVAIATVILLIWVWGSI